MRQLRRYNLHVRASIAEIATREAPNRIANAEFEVVAFIGELHFSMKCHELADRLQQIRPDLAPVEIARICLILLNMTSGDSSNDSEPNWDDGQLQSSWKNASFRLEAATDQYSAVVQELDGLLDDGPIRFTPDQLWTLLRVIKVQGQMLELYTDEPVLV